MSGKSTRSFRKSVAPFKRKRREAKGSERLTRRQGETLGLLARGLTTREIASELGISYDTVRFHLKDIYAKLCVRSRTQAVLEYLRRGPAKGNLSQRPPTQMSG